MKRTTVEEREAYCKQYGHSWIKPANSSMRRCSWCEVSESVLADDEATLRAKNIPSIPPPDLDNAYELTQAIAQAEAAKAAKQAREKPVFGDPTWLERTKAVHYRSERKAGVR